MMDPREVNQYPDGSTAPKPKWFRKCACGAGLGELCDKKGLNFQECIAPWHPAYGRRKPEEAEPLVGVSKAEAEALSVAVANMLTEAAEAPKDNVVLPGHYARFEIEPIRFICENNLNFFQGNIVKYILRWDAKNGLEDLRKARRYLDMFIKWVQKDPDWWKAES